jgi:hypothetical protein
LFNAATLLAIPIIPPEVSKILPLPDPPPEPPPKLPTAADNPPKNLAGLSGAASIFAFKASGSLSWFPMSSGAASILAFKASGSLSWFPMSFFPCKSHLSLYY